MLINGVTQKYWGSSYLHVSLSVLTELEKKNVVILYTVNRVEDILDLESW